MITTLSDLAALPPGAVVSDDGYLIATRRSDGDWDCVGSEFSSHKWLRSSVELAQLLPLDLVQERAA